MLLLHSLCYLSHVTKHLYKEETKYDSYLQNKAKNTDLNMVKTELEWIISLVQLQTHGMYHTRMSLITTWELKLSCNVSKCRSWSATITHDLLTSVSASDWTVLHNLKVLHVLRLHKIFTDIVSNYPHSLLSLWQEVWVCTNSLMWYNRYKKNPPDLSLL